MVHRPFNKRESRATSSDQQHDHKRSGVKEHLLYLAQIERFHASQNKRSHRAHMPDTSTFTVITFRPAGRTQVDKLNVPGIWAMGTDSRGRIDGLCLRGGG